MEILDAEYFKAKNEKLKTNQNFYLNAITDGKHFDENGNFYECCCDECDYMLCCIDEDWNISDYVDLNIIDKPDCKNCTDAECLRKEVR